MHVENTTAAPVQLIAHAWRTLGTVMTFVATCGGSDIDVDLAQRGRASIPQSHIAGIYNSSKSAADVHYTFRQGSLCLEAAYKTKAPVRRILTTLIGVCVTDAYLLYRHRFGEKHASFWQFHRRLAKALAKNDIDSPRTVTRADSQRQSLTPSVEAGLSSALHIPMLLRYHPYYADGHTKDTRLRCAVCGKKTSHCCRECSRGSSVHCIVAVCPVSPSSDCFDQHLLS